MVFNHASWTQIVTYLGAVTVGTIGLLVFLNASISFVITDLLHVKRHMGDATGTLGFADELVAIIFSPIAGFLSDRVGVRVVCLCSVLCASFSDLGRSQRWRSQS